MTLAILSIFKNFRSFTVVRNYLFLDSSLKFIKEISGMVYCSVINVRLLLSWRQLVNNNIVICVCQQLFLFIFELFFKFFFILLLSCDSSVSILYCNNNVNTFFHLFIIFSTRLYNDVFLFLLYNM